MSVLNKMKFAAAAGVFIMSTTAVYAKDVNLRVQSVLGYASLVLFLSFYQSIPERRQIASPFSLFQ